MKRLMLILILTIAFVDSNYGQNIHFQLKTKLEGFMFKPDSLDIFFYSIGETVRLRAKDSFNLNTLDVPNDNSINSNLTLKSNIVANSISFDLNSESHGKATLNIYDISGNSVLTQEIILSAGINSKEIELPNINSGIYFIKITNGNQQYSAKFIKSDKTIGGANNPPIKQVPNIQSSEVIKVTAYLKTFKPQTFDNITIASDTNLVLVMGNRTLGKVKSIVNNLMLSPVTLFENKFTKDNGGTTTNNTFYNSSVYYQDTVDRFIMNDKTDSNSININYFDNAYGYIFQNVIYSLIFDFTNGKLNIINIQDYYRKGLGYTSVNGLDNYSINNLSFSGQTKYNFIFDSLNVIKINFVDTTLKNNEKINWTSTKYIYTDFYFSIPYETDTYSISTNDKTSCNFFMSIEIK